MKKQCEVTFKPIGARITVDEGTGLLDAALSAGVPLKATCGGSGTCGSCKVWLIEGMLESKQTALINSTDFKNGLRLCCQSRVTGNVTVELLSSKAEDLQKPGEKTDNRLHHQLLATGWHFQPMAQKSALKLKPPDINDNQNDLKRLRSALGQKGFKDVIIDYDIVQNLPGFLRSSRWEVSTTVVSGRPAPMLANLEAGDTSQMHTGIAFDIGTTAIRGQLLDLNTGYILAEATAYNSQGSYGEDVISRIAYCRRAGGLVRLQKAVTDTLNSLITTMVKQAKINKQSISHLVVAGNTVMTQLLFGVDPEPLRLSPYVPAFDTPPQMPAASLGINVPRHVYIYAIPGVASYVGGDIVSGITGCGIYQREEISLYIDIGTNGEIVAGNKDWLVTAACSAGPTFEGGGIKFGMLAAQGATEDFTLDPETGEPALTVIGGVKLAGICGSGIINTVCALFQAGILGPNGKFNRESNCPRIREGEDGYEYVMVYGAKAQNGENIVISEMDIDNFIRSKAAIFAGCQTLIDSVGIGLEDIESIVIAGTFGLSINIESAIKVGLLPDVAREKFMFIGNGSLLGARLTSFSQEIYHDGLKVAEMMTNLELSENGAFMDNYIASLFLPHTDSKKFPSAGVGA